MADANENVTVNTINVTMLEDGMKDVEQNYSNGTDDLVTISAADSKQVQQSNYSDRTDDHHQLVIISAAADSKQVQQSNYSDGTDDHHHLVTISAAADSKQVQLSKYSNGTEDHHLVTISVAADSKKEQQSKSLARNHEPNDSRVLSFSVYKRLFVVGLAINMVVLVLAATGNFPYARNRTALFSTANILALTLCRSEVFLRLVFWLVVNLLGKSWIPLPIKTANVGGIHSSCGISSIAWLVFSLVLTLKNRQDSSLEIIVVASTILSLLCLSSLAAFPLVRRLHHNLFERTHRFAGWTALGLLWAFIILTISYDPVTKSYSNYRELLGSKLIKQQQLWFTVVVTVVIITPWVTVRRVPVKVSAPSGHASIIRFEGGVKAGILGRISPSPFSEWHAFGIISDGKTDHMMLAGAVGDFTKSLVSNPPTHLWVRKFHFSGLPYLSNMYDKVLLVATGSGICVFLSFLLQPTRANVCLLWVAKGIEKNFGKEIAEMVSRKPKDKVIVHDTAVFGRPNISDMSIVAAKRFEAQVVIVTSNPDGSKAIVNDCKSAGIPAFGPIWDS